MSNIIELLVRALKEGGATPALHIAAWTGDRSVVRTTSFAQMQAMIAQAQQRLKRAGVRPGSSLLVLADVSAQTYAAIVAAVALGAVIIFAPPAQTKRQTLGFVRRQAVDYALVRSSHTLLRILLRLMGIKAVAVDGETAQPSQAPLEIVTLPDIAERPALISYSSGTTGSPKPIVRSHGKLARQFALMEKYLHSDDGGERVDFTYMGVMALFNMGRGWTSLIPVNMDYTAADISRELGRLVDRYLPARLTGSATFVASALRNASAAGRSAVKFLVLGGAPTDAKVLIEAARAVPRAQLRIFYGSTEAEPIAVLPVSGDIARQYAGIGYPVGRPIAEIEIKIDTEKFRAIKDAAPSPIGEIVVKGAHVIAAAADGWLHTGDTGYLDDAGQLWLTGRAREAIVNGSGALPTYLVEKAINALPEVERAALIQHGSGARLYVELCHGAVLDTSLNDVLAEQLDRLPLKNIGVQAIEKIPLDSRHRCKINRLSLERKP